MKKSHRRDVLIARIIFAVILLLLIAAIAIPVSKALSKRTPSKEAETQTETETQQYFVIDPNQETVDEPETETEELLTITVQTTKRINFRTEPNTDCEVITVLPAGTTLILQGEADGWAQVLYDDQVGYVSTDYIVEVE